MSKERKNKLVNPALQPMATGVKPHSTGRLVKVDVINQLRFPAGDSAENVAEASRQPCCIEVEFKPGELLRDWAKTGAPATTGLASLVKATVLDYIFQQYGYQQAELTFPLSIPASAKLSASALRNKLADDHRSRFYTFVFEAKQNLLQISQELNRLPAVARAVAVPPPMPAGTPENEPRVLQQWYLDRCRVKQAWALPAKPSGQGVVIADIDWGFRVNHQDLRTRIAVARNAVDQGLNVSQGNRIAHGTAVLGILGGADNNAGMAGIAYAADIWAIQANVGTNPPRAENPWAAWVDAIEWVRTADSSGKPKVILLEAQTAGGMNAEMIPSVNQAIRAATDANIVVCVAAGNAGINAGTDNLGNPIPATGSILVGATEFHPSKNRRASFSNWGAEVTISAPGDKQRDLTCSSAADNGYFNEFGGTSSAAAKVAGVVALMMEVNGQLTPTEVKAILVAAGTTIETEAAKPVGRFLNAEAAVTSLLP